MKAKDIAAALEATKHLEPDRTPLDDPMYDKTRIQCVCGSWKHITDMEHINTGVVLAVSNVCKGCKEAVKDDRATARIVCVKCKTVVARMAPHKDNTGFAFKANYSYHINACANCTPGLTTSAIIEKKLHDKSIGRT